MAGYEDVRVRRILGLRHPDPDADLSHPWPLWAGRCPGRSVIVPARGSRGPVDGGALGGGSPGCCGARHHVLHVLLLPWGRVDWTIHLGAVVVSGDFVSPERRTCILRACEAGEPPPL